jgi:hypothetical protein
MIARPSPRGAVCPRRPQRSSVDKRTPHPGVCRLCARGLSGVRRDPRDIACWVIDTNYNGDSFFVRHAYFTGSDNPYEGLKKALRAEIDSDAWASLNSTVSRPFAKPSTGRIAVKVINHYGDDVLKVYEL